MSKKLTLAALLLIAQALAGVRGAQAETKLDFTLLNKTGYGIKEVYIGPTSSESWGENLISEPLENGESVDITFNRAAEGIAKWDLMIAWVDEDNNVYWRGYKLAEISKITLKYDRESGQTTAVTE